MFCFSLKKVATTITYSHQKTMDNIYRKIIQSVLFHIMQTQASRWSDNNKRYNNGNVNSLAENISRM